MDTKVRAAPAGASTSEDGRDVSSESEMDSDASFQVGEAKPVDGRKESPKTDSDTSLTAGAMSSAIHHSGFYSQAGAPKPMSCVGKNGEMDSSVTSQLGTLESDDDGSPATESESSFPIKALGLTPVGSSAGSGFPRVKLHHPAREAQTAKAKSRGRSPS